MQTIEKEAFWHCESLSIIKIPANVRYIGSVAFANCYSIITVIFDTYDIGVEENAFKESGA